MKIACITTSYPRFDGDVAGTFVRDLNVSLVERGHDVVVLAPRSPLARVFDDDGIVVEEVPYLRPRSLERTFYGAGAVDNIEASWAAKLGLVTFPPRLLARTLERTKECDALLAHWAIPSGIAASLTANGRPHVVVFHSADVHALLRTRLASLVVRRLLASRASLVFVASALRDRLFSALSNGVAEAAIKRTHILPMGFAATDPTTPREALRAELGLFRFSVVTLGRLVPIKGLDVLVRALAHLDVELIVLGDGPEKPRLEALASATGTRVRFAGRVNDANKWRWLNAADLFAMPSLAVHGRTEGLPVALLEAMHAGLPIVATNSGGITEALAEGAGRLVSPGDVQELRNAIVELVDDNDIRTSYVNNAKRRAKAFEWANITPRFERLLRSTD